jgi:hypothetical protein
MSGTLKPGEQSMDLQVLVGTDFIFVFDPKAVFVEAISFPEERIFPFEPTH